MEKLENKLIDMRELYEESERNDFQAQVQALQVKNLPSNAHVRKFLNFCNIFLQEKVQDKSHDPFYETQENHNLIGVANVFLEALFHDVKLDYHTPIISQQGEVAGRLQVCNCL